MNNVTQKEINKTLKEYKALITNELLEELEVFKKALNTKQLKYAYLTATGLYSQDSCVVQAGYSGGNIYYQLRLLRKHGLVTEAIKYFQTEFYVRHGFTAQAHRRYLTEVRDSNKGSNDKVSLQAEKILLEMEGHIGSAKAQRGGSNVQINITGLIPETVKISQQPIEGSCIDPEADN